MENKTVFEDTVNISIQCSVQESQTDPYYSIFQQLVICLISIRESNVIIINSKTERQTEGSVWSLFQLNQLCGLKAASFRHQRRFHTWQLLRNMKVGLFR